MTISGAVVDYLDNQRLCRQLSFDNRMAGLTTPHHESLPRRQAPPRSRKELTAKRLQGDTRGAAFVNRTCSSRYRRELVDGDACVIGSAFVRPAIPAKCENILGMPPIGWPGDANCVEIAPWERLAGR